ncbi:hypothetical protein Tco_0863473 [Tanacetum coccineum]
MAVVMKHMASNFAKLEKFEGVDFRRWQKKMHFLLSNMSVVYVLTTPMPDDGGDNPTVEQVRKRAKWDNDDYVCRCLILKASSKHALSSDQRLLKSNGTKTISMVHLHAGRVTHHQAHLIGLSLQREDTLA